MEIVYKFCDKYGLEILRNLELKVTPPNQFNDPFEFTPNNFCSDPVGYATKNLEREPALQILYRMLQHKGKFSGSFEEFKKIAKRDKDKWVPILAEAPYYTSPFVDKALLDEVRKGYGILCLSKRRDKILMWGHYCDKLLGIVIGFDKSSAVFQQGKGLRPVTYVKERVACDACWEVGSPELLQFEEQVIFFKSDEWLYEDEFRQFFPLSSTSLKKKPLDNKEKYSKNFLWKCVRSFKKFVGLKNKDQPTGYFLPFPPEAIVSVTLGPRSSPELEKEVREILQKPCYADVKLDHAVFHKSDFVLEFE